MTNQNNHSNFTQKNNCLNSKQQDNSFNAIHDSGISTPNKYKNVEPLPESSRPRRDGPGGEDGD
ncbi:hypothetical protein SAMN02745163_02622 [Clostridium cavendishii DSM 21758]|uniref:Uncharacterized protein n=1 Tax=Clostridium cavendishii DSM 21758 TaxID=1121302 RepID=A0A1M6MFU0_9CLOT|nr:hypothetical protein [Clostridium cavendishii]SHJ82297.1 hypothetical protein SAMN02745163_02622 [Clostridium cavendishii DSM 21758]